MHLRFIVTAAILCLGSGAWAQGLVGGLVARYDFDGNAKDSSGNGNNGLLHGGIVPTADRNGVADSALQFNGTDAYVSVPDAASLNPTDQISIAFWARVDGTATLWSTIVFKGTVDDSGCRGGRQYSVWLNSAPYFHSSSAADGGCSTFLVSKNVSVLNKWTHVVLTIDRRTTGKGIFYVNGNVSAQADDPYSSFQVTAADLLIGRTPETASNYSLFQGALDDVRIYNRVLSKAEVQRLYRTSLEVSGSTSGFNTVSVTCKNARTAQEITFQSKNGTSSTWNCEDQGLVIKAGDKVDVTLSGPARK